MENVMENGQTDRDQTNSEIVHKINNFLSKRGALSAEWDTAMPYHN